MLLQEDRPSGDETTCVGSVKTIAVGEVEAMVLVESYGDRLWRGSIVIYR